MGDDKIIEMVEKNETGVLGAVHYLVSIAIYCVIGLAIDYWLFVAAGAATAWANPITYLVMIFWPFVLMWEFLVIMFWLFLIIAAIIGIVVVIKAMT